MLQKTLTFILAGTVALSATPFVFAAPSPPPTQLDLRVAPASTSTDYSTSARRGVLRELVVGMQSSVDPVLKDRRIDPSDNPQALLRKCRELNSADRMNCMKTGVATSTLSSSSSASAYPSSVSALPDAGVQSSVSDEDRIPALINSMPTLPANCRSLQYNGSTSAYTDEDMSNCLRPWLASMRANLNEIELWMENNGIDTGKTTNSYDWYNTSSLPSGGMSSSY